MHHAHTSTTHAPSGAGFSLIEVLIAVVVLAFGLLGLAAVFPAVVKQQTTAKDSVQGVSVLRSAEQLVLGHLQLNEHQTVTTLANDLATIANRRGWETLTAETAWNIAGDGGESGWPALVLPTGGVYSASRTGVIYDRVNGDMAIGRPTRQGGVLQRGVVIPLSQRLFPSPYLNPGTKPEYVWDMVVRRLDLGVPHTDTRTGTAELSRKYEDDGILAVIFVRRIDPGIRPARAANYPLAYALADSFFNPPTPAGQRVPVSERADGTPTLDGATAGGSGYSTPKRVVVGFPDLNLLDAVTVSAVASETQAEIVSQARQVGQVLVDALGILHRVREVQTKNPQNPADAAWVPRLIVEPPFDVQVREWGDAHVVFTPQIPAAVGVVRIDPRKGGRL